MIAKTSSKAFHVVCKSCNKFLSFENRDSQWDLDRWTTPFLFGFSLQVSDCEFCKGTEVIHMCVIFHKVGAMC